MRTVIATILALASSAIAQAPSTVTTRLEDVIKIQGADSHTIFGVGLVTGLDGTGDSALAAREMIVNFLKRMGLNQRTADVTTGGIAMVTVKVTVPPFAKPGQDLDTKVSIINDASSLRGGELEITALSGIEANGVQIEGIASGRVYVGGASYGTADANVTINHPTVGTVIDGCQLTTAPKTFYLSDAGDLELRFLNPSVTTVVSAVDGINKLVSEDGFKAEIVDQYMLRIRFPEGKQNKDEAVRLLDRILRLPVATSQIAKVVIDETSGMILAGEGVQISPCVFAVGNIQISVVSQQEVSQPLPGINQGTTELVNRTRVEVIQDQGNPQVLKGGATVEELVKNLTVLQLSPAQLIAIFQKLKSSGYLHAELEYR